MYNRTFRTIAVDEGLTLVEQARLFAMLNLAGADAVISCWDDKAHWGFWRPITAIREGDDDGNPQTAGDPMDAARGHPAVSGPPVRLQLRDRRVHAHRQGLLRRGPLDFSSSGRAGVPNVRASYTHFTDVIDDTIDARVYQGIHFRAADVQGAEIGKDVARWLAKLLPASEVI